MARDLKLQVVLAAIDKATAPIKSVMQGSVGLGRALKETRETLKGLQAQQKDVSSFRALKGATENTSAALKASRAEVRDLSRQIAAVGVPTKEMSQRFQDAVRHAQALKQEHRRQSRDLQALRNKLAEAGISTKNLSEHERQLRQRVTDTNRTLGQQEARLKALAAQQKRLAVARQQFEKAQQVAGGMAAGGAAGLASGYAIAKPLQGMVDAFTPAENAATQLKVAMMDKNGQVSADFQRITDLATSLGDRLPGTTADFQEMMTMLRRQGMSAQSILGGTGEAAAYLGVQLQKPAAEAAEFAAKMQDATRTAEKDMMGLMDIIQRAYYLGVDDNNMLQGFTKLSPVMGIIKKEGLDAANTLAPLLVMMDQTGMAGESAGNAIRKVFQSGVDEKRFTKANAALAQMKAGFDLDFTNGKGEFGGVDNLFAQLEKLKKLTSVQRTSVMKELFGDDSETLQVVNTLMNKGLAGYQEVADKMQAQADLQARVKEQLGTLGNTLEAAQGSWSNAMAEVGATVAPELKELINGLGNVAVRVKDWVKANPQLTAAIFKTAAGLALMLATGGGIAVMLASILGPFAMVRYGLTLLGIKGASLGGVLFNLGKVALPLVGKGILFIGRALMANPIGLAVAAIAAAAYLIYTNWEPIKAWFSGLWAEIKAAFDGGVAGVGALILNWSPLGLFYKAFSGVMNYFGVEMPGKFTEFGGMLLDGMVNGITAGLGRVKEAITGAGESTITWFKEKLGIHSPSRVFSELGGYTMEGLTQGLAGGEGGALRQVSDTAKRLAAAGAVTLAASGSALAVDSRPPLAANYGAGSGQGGSTTIQITIQAAPGQDPSAIARAVAAELDRRERASQARSRSALYDQE